MAVPDQWLTFCKSSRREIRNRAFRNLAKSSYDCSDPRLTPIILDGFTEYTATEESYEVVRVLFRSRDPCLIKPMIAYLKHPKVRIRAIACEVLGNLNDKIATDPLISCLDDSHLMVRLRATQALGALRDPKAIRALLQHYTNEQHEDFNVLGALQVALEKHGEHPIDVLKLGRASLADTGEGQN